MQNQPPYDDADNAGEEADPRESLINNSAATREIMMRMLSPQRYHHGISPIEGSSIRGHRVDDYRIASAASSSAAGQHMPMIGGPMGNPRNPPPAMYLAANNMTEMPPSGANDEEMINRMILFRQQHMAAMESLYGRRAFSEVGSEQLSNDEMHRMISQQRAMEPRSYPTQGRGSLGRDSRGAPRFHDVDNSTDHRSPSQWRNFPPANLMQRPEYNYQHDGPQRLDIPNLPLQDMMWRQAMASAAHQKRGYDDPRLAHMSGMEDQSKQRADDTAAPPKKKRRARKKPADMPRRPLSAYNLFFSEERERILAEITGEEAALSSAQIDSDTKSEAVPGSTDAAAKPEGSDPSSDSAVQKPAIKALLRPLVPTEKQRRPHRKTHGKISFKELAKMVGQRWKNQTDDRRKYYQDLANEDMKRQRVAMEEYYKKQKKEQQGSAAEVVGKGEEGTANLKSE